MRFCFEMPEKGKLPNGRANGQKLQLFPKNSWNCLNRSVFTGASFSDGSVLLFGLARQKASRVISRLAAGDKTSTWLLPGRLVDHHFGFSFFLSLLFVLIFLPYFLKKGRKTRTNSKGRKNRSRNDDLRVSPAVTRLTVYRRLQVRMRGNWAG